MIPLIIKTKPLANAFCKKASASATAATPVFIVFTTPEFITLSKNPKILTVTS